ncbi:MAG: hypothetical protein ACI3ZF_04845 [Candidatus Cryptobacteroides sp.]
MKICRLILSLSILLLSSLNFAASARVRDWDKVLDRYEKLCDKCLELKRQEESGETISKRELSKLMKELGSLKNELKEGSGKMSPEQKERFQRIRNRFISMPIPEPISAPPSPSATPAIVVQLPAQERLSRPEPTPEDQPIPTPKRHIQMPELPKYQSSNSLSLPEVEKIPASKSQLLGRKYFVSGSANVCIYPRLSYGIMCALDPVECLWGTYLRFSSNFISRDYDYDCLSNGDTSFGSIWTSGESSYSSRQWAAGACYRLNNWLRIYAGAGYGQVVTCWEDSSGSWARVVDLSPCGILLDAGALFNLGKLEVNIGINCTAFKLTALQIGIGYGF